MALSSTIQPLTKNGWLIPLPCVHMTSAQCGSSVPWGPCCEDKIFKLSSQSYEGSIPVCLPCSQLRLSPLPGSLPRSSSSWISSCLAEIPFSQNALLPSLPQPLPQVTHLQVSDQKHHSSDVTNPCRTLVASQGHILLLHRTRCLLPVIGGLHRSYHTESK